MSSRSQNAPCTILMRKDKHTGQALGEPARDAASLKVVAANNLMVYILCPRERCGMAKLTTGGVKAGLQSPELGVAIISTVAHFADEASRQDCADDPDEPVTARTMAVL